MKKPALKLAKTLTAICVRNAEIENIHFGKPPVTKTGDYSDVKVIDAEGNEFAWPDVSHINESADERHRQSALYLHDIRR